MTRDMVLLAFTWLVLDWNDLDYLELELDSKLDMVLELVCLHFACC